MKVLGGIKGISNSNQGLEKYLLTTAQSYLKGEYFKINDENRRTLTVAWF